MANRLPKILIVDDEPQIQRFLRAGLPPHGYACIEAATAAEALKLFARGKPRRRHPRSRPARPGRLCRARTYPRRGA
ncbi:MAG: hypothetical protein WDN08_07295 [Rhizomicrobium sp.]